MNDADIKLKLLGFDNISETSKIHDDLESLRSCTPIMCVGESILDFHFSIFGGSQKPFKQGDRKVMSLDMYSRLEYDKKAQKQCLKPAGINFADIYKPYTGQDLTDKSLLVWRTGGIGDILFIQPNLIHLKKQYPSCKITFCCSPVYFPLINNWDCIDKFLNIPLDLSVFEQCDYHLTFEGVIERCHVAEKENAYSLFSQWMGLDLPPEKLRPVLYTKKKNNKLARKILKQKSVKEKKFICLQVRASSPIRTPSTYVWIQMVSPLIEKGYDIVILDKPDMEVHVDMFIKQFPEKLRRNIHNFCGVSTAIDMAVSFVNLSKMVIAPDSSLVHIAAALRIPVFGVYGPFTGNVRMSYYLKADWIDPVPSTVCKYGGKGCYLHGHNPCPFNVQGASPCFNEIDFNLANDKILTLLDEK